MDVYNVLLVPYGTTCTKELYRLDEEQYLKFIGFDLPPAYRVDFGLSETGDTISVVGNSDGVLIPDNLLQKAGKLHVWIWLNTGTYGGKTCYHLMVPVKRRGDVTDVEPTQSEQQQIDALISALNDGVTTAEASSTNATEKAAEASASAQSASDSLDSINDLSAVIQGYAQEAVAAAESAEASAQEAARVTENGLFNSKAPAIMNSLSGSYIYFYDGADQMALNKLTVDIGASASGKTSAFGYAMGESLADNLTWTPGYYDNNGRAASNENMRRSADYIKVTPGESYLYYSEKDIYDLNPVLIHEYDANMNWLRQVAFDINPVTSWTGSNDAEYIRISKPKFSDNIRVGKLNRIVSISWETEAGLVYGGTLTINQNGSVILIPNRAKFTIGSRNWTLFNDVFYTTVDVNPDIWPFAEGYTAIESKPGTSSANQWPDRSICAHMGGEYIYIKDSRYSTVDELKTGEENTEIVYGISDPIRYRLSDIEQIKTLKGINHIWFDCGNISVEYPADTKLFIEDNRQDTEPSMIAAQNIENNTYFMVGNNLYISTATITSGEALIPGTNCTAVSLADALNAINS